MAKYVIKKEFRIDLKQWYYWQLWSDKNHKEIARSSESYSSKQEAYSSIRWTQKNAMTQDITDLT